MRSDGAWVFGLVLTLWVLFVLAWMIFAPGSAR